MLPNKLFSNKKLAKLLLKICIKIMNAVNLHKNTKKNKIPFIENGIHNVEHFLLGVLVF